MLTFTLAGACIEAAKARCTLGEMCSAMETVFGRHSAAVSLATGAYTSEYGDDATEVATTRQLVKQFADKHGRRPRILVAKMGQDGHDRGQKVMCGTCWLGLAGVAVQVTRE